MTSRDSTFYTPEGYIAAGLRDGAAREHFLTDVPPGLHISHGSLPPGLVVVENFLHPRLRDRLAAHALAATGTPSTVQAPEAAAGEALTRLSADRVTDYVSIDGLESEVHTLMRDVFTRQVARHYGVNIEWYERAELLRYGAGGLYRPHADADNWDPVRRRWTRGIDRDFSVLIYLNQDFEGGALEFPNFGFRLSPRAGMLVIFPSDHRYVHAARPITAGVRLVLVSWCAARGTRRVGERAPDGATAL